MLTTAYLPLCKVHTYLCYILASFPGSSLGPGNEVRKLRYVLKDAELDGPLWFFCVQPSLTGEMLWTWRASSQKKRPVSGNGVIQLEQKDQTRAATICRYVMT